MTGKQSLLHRLRIGLCHWRLAPVLVAGGVALLAGCDRGGGLQITAELDERQFQRAKQALDMNQKQVALEAFLKVIDKRMGDAPESHLEAGRIYLDHMKDEVPAIYHFKKYLELQPNGRNATEVQRLKERAETEYGRKLAARLAGNPLGVQYDILELRDQNETLRAQNANLLRQIEDLSRARGLAPVAATDPRRTPPIAERPVAPSPSTNQPPYVVPVDVATQPQPDAGRAPPQRPGTDAGNTQVGSGRTYVVQQGETLSAISRKFYGTPARWKDIARINQDRIPDPNVLTPGIEIRLP